MELKYQNLWCAKLYGNTHRTTIELELDYFLLAEDEAEVAVSMAGKNATPNITWGGLASTTRMTTLNGKNKKKRKKTKTKRR